MTKSDIFRALADGKTLVVDNREEVTIEDTRGYTFSYPEQWAIKDDSADYTIVKDNKDDS